MIKIKARQLLQYTTSQLWDILSGNFILILDDGCIETNATYVLYSSYIWDIHRNYINLPLLKNHCVDEHLVNGLNNSKTHLSLLSAVFKDYLHYYNVNTKEEFWQLAPLIRIVVNNMYNDLSIRLSGYVESTDILDILEIIGNKGISNTIDNADKSPAGINKAISDIKHIMETDPVLDNNIIVKMYRAGVVKKDQVIQCIGLRGYLMDIDSSIFSKPVMRGYAYGIRKLYDSMVESRSASRSIVFNQEYLQNSEYFARRVHLVTMFLENIHDGDCGSTKYLNWMVRDDEYDDDNKIKRVCDLKHMAGIWYLDETDNVLKKIKGDEKHLIGTVIKIRSVIAGCNHPDIHGVCAVCVGDMKNHIYPNTNVGMTVSWSFSSKLSGSMLATKHMETSGKSECIELSNVAKQFLTTIGTDTNIVRLKNIRCDNVKIKIPQRFFPGYISLIRSNELSISEFDISKLYGIIFIIKERNMEVEYPIDFSKDYNIPSLSYSFLEFIKHADVNIVDDCYEIKLDGWDVSNSFLTYPFKQKNMYMYTKTIAQLLEISSERLREFEKNPHAIYSSLRELFDLVNEKLNVHLSIVCLTFYAYLIRDTGRMDYRTPKGNTNQHRATIHNLMCNRSLSVLYSYQDILNSGLYNPASFFDHGRGDHILDVFYHPREVVDHVNKKKLMKKK